MAESETDVGRASHRIQELCGRRIRELRDAGGLSQMKLARTAGVGVRTVQRLEAGRSASLNSVLRLLVALGVAERLPGALAPPPPAPDPGTGGHADRRQGGVRRWFGPSWDWMEGGEID